jgi:hypothetical protein
MYMQYSGGRRGLSKAQADIKKRYENFPMQHWRSWGSWFSWGSPVGLGLFYALVVISTGIFIWLVQ